MTLAVFVGDLRSRLATLSVEQLRDIVIDYGQGLSGADRAAFLELFPPTDVAPYQTRQWSSMTRCRPISSS